MEIESLKAIIPVNVSTIKAQALPQVSEEARLPQVDQWGEAQCDGLARGSDVRSQDALTSKPVPSDTATK
jgi:hypothetical protein